MSSFMASHFTIGLEFLLTGFAFIWSLACVQPFMNPQFMPIGKLFITLIASKRLFTSMLPLVSLEITSIVAREVALIAYMGFFSRMLHHVSPEIISTVAGIMALVATELFLP